MTPNPRLILLGAVAMGTAGLGMQLFRLMVRTTPEKRERKRRLMLHQYGRLGDAFITEATEEMLYYSYSVGGVQYETSQDLGGLRHLLPVEPQKVIGHASLKYSAKNPANSILICEEWSGLRAPSRAA